MKISLAMIVKNEEKYVERCIKSVQNLVDEIVVVDTGSNDRTIEIVEKLPNVNLFHFNWCDDFSKARNFSIENSTGDYILVLDADEYVVSGSREDLTSVMDKNQIGKISIISRFMKDNQEHHSVAKVSRFFPRDTRYTGMVHEQIESSRLRININLLIYHDGYFETNKSERNIPLLISEVKKNPHDSYYLFQLGKELRINNQHKESFHFLEQAYKNIDRNATYYGELVVELINSGKEYGENKLFKIISQNEDSLENLCDFHFAKGLFYMDFCFNNPEKAIDYIHFIEMSFLKCLSLSDHSKVEIVRGTGSFLAAYNLGVFYEVTGNIEKASYYYNLLAE